MNFFREKGHAAVLSSSLVPSDPSVLLTTAGMQQFKPYYTGEADPVKDFGSKNTVSIQKCFRTSDIDEVGDETHLTFFEMLGNFSFGYKPGEPVSPKGGYWKEEAIKLAHEFITKEMSLPISYVTVFKGSEVVPTDEESRAIWRSLGVEDIREEGMEDVFWGPTGSSGPCGPTTEIYCKNASGQDVEIWNIVFNEFFCEGSREELLAGKAKLRPLAVKGIDTGMGLERLAMISQGAKNIFETDLFRTFHPRLFGGLGHERETRIVADHLRASVFLLSDGVRPSNKGAGYILRRLIRRTMMQTRRTGFSEDSLLGLVDGVIKDYGSYSELESNRDDIKREFVSELEKFSKTLASGIREFFAKFPEWVHSDKSSDFHKIRKISGDDAFYFYQSHGLTLDVIKDLAKLGGHIVEIDENEFERAMKKHQEISRAGAEKKFGGHGLLLDTGELKAGTQEEVAKVTRLHTATHLLQYALRKVLGNEVKQMGSDITQERTRFDFSFPRKLSPDELRLVESEVNSVIAADIPVIMKEMDYDEALKGGALAFFKAKYPRRVKVYSIEGVSRELCGGPHVEHTGEIGKFKILKEEAVSSGVRRVRGTIE